MSTGNDPALPDPQDQPPIDTAVAAVAAQAGTEPPAPDKPPLIQSIEEVDPDEIALREATAQAEAEEAGAAAETQTDQPQGQPDPANAKPQGAVEGQKPEGQQQPQGEQPQTVMIPKPRVDALAQRAYRAEQENAYLKGMLAARGQPAQPGNQQQQQPQQTPEQRLAAINQAQDALAARFDAGEITMAEFKREERTLNNSEQAIREEQLAAKLRPQHAPAPPPASNLYLAEKTIEIEDANPWVGVADKVGTPVEWQSVKNMAIDRLVERGVDPTDGELGKFELRKEVAKVWTELGPAMLAGRAQAKGIAIPGTQPQSQAQPQQRQGQQQQQPQLSPAAKARLDKLDKAQGAPPDLAAMNGNIGDPAGISEERLETITEEDFDRLPAATRNKLLGISA